MVRLYSELTDEQKVNTWHIIDKAQGHELNKLKSSYSITGRSLEQMKNNLSHNLAMDLIPFEEFYQWLCNVHLEGNNTLYIYEPEDKAIFKKNNIESLFKANLNKIEPLYNLSPCTLDKIELVNIVKESDKNQIMFTFAAPSQIQVKDDKTGLHELVKDIYLAYIIMDFELEHFVLLMHPTVNLVSLMGEIKKSDFDVLTYIIMNNFKNKIINFKSVDPKWLITGLYNITTEYFHHNNPIIEQKVKEFESNHLQGLIKSFQESENSLKRPDCTLRLKRMLLNSYESELVVLYGTKTKEISFEVFFQQSDKGVTSYKANSKGKPLSYAESADIVKLMWQNGDIFSLGITHKVTDDNGMTKAHPYIVTKTSHCFSLKKYYTSSTEKEVIDDVLRKLNKYKQKVRPALRLDKKSRYRADNSKT